MLSLIYRTRGLKFFGTIVFRIMLLIVGLFWSVTVYAQDEGPPPPTVSLDAPRFDSGRDVYLLDLVYTRPEAIGALEISLVGPEGVEVLHTSALPKSRNQTIELDASTLQAGATYRIEIKGFDPNGAPISSSGGETLLASRDFTHLPGVARLGGLHFKVDLSAARLTIELDVSMGPAIAGYRIILENGSTHAVALDVRQNGPPPLVISLESVPAGDYQVTVVALDSREKPLTQVSDKFVYEAGVPNLGSPLFEYQQRPPALLIRLETNGSQAFSRYQVSLVNSATNQVALDYEAPVNGTQVAVPVEGLPAGDYLVLIRALDSSGGVLANTQGKTTYSPPPAPSAWSRIISGMSDAPLIPVLMVIVLITGILGISLYSLKERRATATPILQGWGQEVGNPNSLPLNRTVVQDPQATLEPASSALRPPVLTLTVDSSPDKKNVGKSFRIARFPFTIGRSDSDLSLSGDEHISRKHAELNFNERGLFIMDRLSTNGTYVNGERIASDQPLRLDPWRSNRIRLGRDTEVILLPTENRQAHEG